MERERAGMSEVKDPAIKLFGKTIQLLSDEAAAAAAATSLHDNKKLSRGEVTETKQDDTSSQPTILLEDLICSATTSSGISEDPKTSAAEKETPSPITNKKDSSDPNETSATTSDEKTLLKKPDKIIPCPRCNSMDTKFCYYNNYNVNQPRHFCKNCQRYWTAGGTMRNVPVGSGRRKNKSSPSSHYRHIMVSESLLAARADGSANGSHLLTNTGSVLAFGSGSDEPLCESMASVLNLADKSTNNVTNEIRVHEKINESGEDRSTGNSSNQGPPPQIPCFPAPPWPTPWNAAPWTNPMPPPGFGPSTYPVSFYPVPQYWGYTVPSPWSMPLLSPQPSSSDHSALSLSNPNSLTLGKHYRDGSKEEEKYWERGVLIPKTLRINDPNEAAKSSIWSTLGINNENSESTGGSSLFKAFQPKGSNEKNHMVETSPVLQANPAALSRSLNFHETS